MIAGDIIALISTVFLAVEIFLIYMQIRNQIKESNEQNERILEQRIEEYNKMRCKEALDAAAYYEKEIISLNYYIQAAVDKTQIKEIIESLKTSCLYDFDEEELKKNVSPQNIQLYNKIISELDPSSLAAARMTYINDSEKTAINLAMLSGKNPEININEENIKAYLRNQFFVGQMDLLNKLECFAMKFTSGLADDDVLFQSLHQTFIMQMKICYIAICQYNNNRVDKVYTNAICLYRKWNDRVMAQMQKEEDARKCVDVDPKNKIRDPKVSKG